MARSQGRVTRFVVMAMLQAARARRLGLPQESAYSWGLNRAIFYAAAKRGFGHAAPSAPGTSTSRTEQEPTREVYELGDEQAIRDPDHRKLYFTIGGRPQTESDFERQVAARFGSATNFRTAWTEAADIVEEQDPSALRSRRRFFEEVYKPRRDELSERWSREFAASPSPMGDPDPHRRPPRLLRPSPKR